MRRPSRLLTSNRYAVSFVLVQYLSGSRNADTGRWEKGLATRTPSCTGNIQPATTTERLQLPEAERLSEAIMIYFITMEKDDIRSLRIGLQQSPPDIIEYDGLQWAVRSVKDWHTSGHLEVLCTRLENQDG